MSYNKRGAELQRKYAALANEMEKEYIPEYLEVISIVGLFQIILMK